MVPKLLYFILFCFFCFFSQNAMVSFKELCGLTPAANMKQCILTVSTWLMNSERSLRVTVDLSETYPTMEAQGPVPELLRKVLNAYDMVNSLHTHKILFLGGLKPPFWPVRWSSCSYSLYNFTCPSPPCLLSYKNTAFFTTWHWHGPKGRWSTVISYHPLFSSHVLWGLAGAGEVGHVWRAMLFCVHAAPASDTYTCMRSDICSNATCGSK